MDLLFQVFNDIDYRSAKASNDCWSQNIAANTIAYTDKLGALLRLRAFLVRSILNTVRF